MPFVPSSFLSLVVWPGAPSSVLAPFVAMPFAPSSFLSLVVRPGAPSSVLAPFVAMPFAPSSFLSLVDGQEPLVASLLRS